MWSAKDRIYLPIFLFSLLIAFSVNAADNIAAIAVATDDSRPESIVSEKAGRAAYFLLFDANGNFLATEKNPFAGVPGGAGPKVAEFLSNKGVTLVLAGGFGTKMERALDLYKIKHILQKGVAREVIQTVTK